MYNDLKNIVEYDPATARGRNRSDGREIELCPTQEEIERCTKARVEAYIATAKGIAEAVRASRSGINDKELERVELVREELYHIAQDTFINMLKNR